MAKLASSSIRVNTSFIVSTISVLEKRDDEMMLSMCLRQDSGCNIGSKKLLAEQGNCLLSLLALPALPLALPIY